MDRGLHRRAASDAMKATALIAEDEPLLAQALQAELAALWPELQVVAVAPNGLQAQRDLLAQAPDIAFLDVRMPGASGIEVAQAIAEDWPEGSPAAAAGLRDRLRAVRGRRLQPGRGGLRPEAGRAAQAAPDGAAAQAAACRTGVGQRGIRRRLGDRPAGGEASAAARRSRCRHAADGQAPTRGDGVDTTAQRAIRGRSRCASSRPGWATR